MINFKIVLMAILIFVITIAFISFQDSNGYVSFAKYSIAFVGLLLVFFGRLSEEEE